MRKLFVVLFAIVMAAMLAMTASAEDLPAGFQESKEIAASVDPRLPVKERKEALRQAYLEAGWTDTSNDMAIAAFADVDPELEALAYMDLDTADEAQKEKILAARNEIIIHTQWETGNPEFLSYVENPVKREFGFAPDFYDIFPADWEIPADLVGAEIAQAPIDAVDLAVGFAEEFARKALVTETVLIQ